MPPPAPTPDERLRAAGGHQLGQRQPGHYIFGAGHRLCPASGGQPGAALRALVVSNLSTLHIKEGIGRLSAYCGAVGAGCGAGAGIAYLNGGDYTVLATPWSTAWPSVGHHLRRRQGILCGQDCLGGGRRHPGLFHVPERAAVPGGRRHRQAGRGKHHPLRGLLASEGMQETDKELSSS